MIYTFTPHQKDELTPYISFRPGEQKIGETCFIGELDNDAPFAIIGVAESIGPQANGGFSGAEFGYITFLKRLLNIQHNHFLKGENFTCYGIIANSSQQDISDLHAGVEELDELIFTIATQVLHAGKIPIVIGGGHNNAYPLIKAAASIHQKINVINLDPHADCRKTDKRHSGNPFSFAIEQQFILNYGVLALHQSYNNQYILDFLTKHNCFHTFYEEYLFEQRSFQADLMRINTTFNTVPIGIELDMDSIPFSPSSAFTPSGISMDDARKYLHYMGKMNKIAYLHLPEAAPMNLYEEKISGKMLAYLVSDFIKSYLKHRI